MDVASYLCPCLTDSFSAMVRVSPGRNGAGGRAASGGERASRNLFGGANCAVHSFYPVAALADDSKGPLLHPVRYKRTRRSLRSFGAGLLFLLWRLLPSSPHIADAAEACRATTHPIVVPIGRNLSPNYTWMIPQNKLFLKPHKSGFGANILFILLCLSGVHDPPFAPFTNALNRRPGRRAAGHICAPQNRNLLALFWAAVGFEWFRRAIRGHGAVWPFVRIALQGEYDYTLSWHGAPPRQRRTS